MKFLILILLMVGCSKIKENPGIRKASELVEEIKFGKAPAEESIYQIEMESFYGYATDPMQSMVKHPAGLKPGDKYHFTGKVKVDSERKIEIVKIETLNVLEKTAYEQECKVLPLEDHVITKGEKYFVGSVAYLKRRVGPEKFDHLGFKPEMEKLEKVFSLENAFEIKDIVEGKESGVLAINETQPFYQISDEFWVMKEGLYRNLKNCDYKDKLWAGQAAGFQVKAGVKLVDYDGAWIKSSAKLACRLGSGKNVVCQSEDSKKTDLTFSEIPEKLEPIRI